MVQTVNKETRLKKNALKVVLRRNGFNILMTSIIAFVIIVSSVNYQMCAASSGSEEFNETLVYIYEAEDLTAGNVVIDTGRFGIGLMIDSGQGNSWCQWRISLPEGTYSLYAEYASGSFRPFIALFNNTYIGFGGDINTGGFSVEDLKWQKIGVVKTASEGILELKSFGSYSFPHLKALKLTANNRELK